MELVEIKHKVEKNEYFPTIAAMGNYTIVGTQLILKDTDDIEIARWDLSPNIDSPISRIRV